jgi:hypothetical protein
MKENQIFEKIVETCDTIPKIIRKVDGTSLLGASDFTSQSRKKISPFYSSDNELACCPLLRIMPPFIRVPQKV